MKYKLAKNKIVLLETPTIDKFNGIKVIFSPSKRWSKKNTHLLPEIFTNIFSGQRTYRLPSYFRAKSILKIEFPINES